MHSQPLFLFQEQKMSMKRSNRLVVLLLLGLGLTGCGAASTPEATPTDVPAAATIAPTPTPAQIDLTTNIASQDWAQIDLTNNIANQDWAQWAARCSQNTAGRPITELAEMEPFKAVVLALDPKYQQWEANLQFPTLINTTGQPKYLVCLFKTWTSVANYTTDNRIVPGYREDWKITVQVLDTGKIYETESLVGADPPYQVTYQESYRPLTEIVGGPPWGAARSLLQAKQSSLVASATLSVPYGFESIDFAPDSRSLYVPFEDGFRKWDFSTKTQAPLRL
jgi:hypothetical protein